MDINRKQTVADAVDAESPEVASPSSSEVHVHVESKGDAVTLYMMMASEPVTATHGRLLPASLLAQMCLNVDEESGWYYTVDAPLHGNTETHGACISFLAAAAAPAMRAAGDMDWHLPFFYL